MSASKDKTEGQHEARLDALEQYRVENRQVLQNIFDKLDTISVKLTAMASRPDLSDRVDALEKWRNMIVGGATVVCVLFSGAIALVWNQVEKLLDKWKLP